MQTPAATDPLDHVPRCCPLAQSLQFLQFQTWETAQRSTSQPSTWRGHRMLPLAGRSLAVKQLLPLREGRGSCKGLVSRLCQLPATSTHRPCSCPERWFQDPSPSRVLLLEGPQCVELRFRENPANVCPHFLSTEGAFESRCEVS